MTTDGPISALELHEFRLNAAADASEAARLVDSFSGGIEPAVPLLVSLDDRRDVAIVRALHASESALVDHARCGSLDLLVTSWQEVKRYGPRITERAAGAGGPSAYYRLAVTESGINDAADDGLAAPQRADNGASTAIDLLWIGVPVGSGAGLLVLLGDGAAEALHRPDARAWTLPLSRRLGVRMYESRR